MRRTSKKDRYLRRRVRLCPTKAQEQMLFFYAGAARWAFNEALAWSNKLYRDFGVTAKAKALRLHIRNLRDGFLGYEWIKKVPECITKKAVADMVEARNRFFRKQSGYPRFKSKRKTRPSFFMRSDTYRRLSENQIRITGFKEPLRFRGGNISEKPLDIHIYYDGKFWMFSYAEKVGVEEVELSQNVLGIDLGILALMTTSDGDCYENINRKKEIKKLKKRLKRKQRKLSRKYEMNKGRGKSKNILKLEREIRLLHKRIKDIRNTYNHEVSRDIVRRLPKAVVLEDLNISGMMKNRHLSREIQDCAFYDLTQKITYKAELKGIPVLRVSRFFPSSKRCSNCGEKRDQLSLSEREYYCPKCGFKSDRDLNAALNLKKQGELLIT